MRLWQYTLPAFQNTRATTRPRWASMACGSALSHSSDECSLGAAVAAFMAGPPRTRPRLADVGFRAQRAHQMGLECRLVSARSARSKLPLAQREDPKPVRSTWIRALRARS